MIYKTINEEYNTVTHEKLVTMSTLIHDRSLVQIRDWHLVKSLYANHICFVIHECCNPSNLNRYPFELTHCHICGDPVPHELQALVALHNWDYQ